MSDPEGFLSRWSRRKRTAAESESVAEAEHDAADAELKHDEPATVEIDLPESAASKTSSDEPALDLAKLPSIEEITAETDIRAFLAPGVPASLRMAALRKAWVADPSIRNFIEVAENQWDFNAPGVPGFDLSPPTGDIARMVAEIFGEKSPDESGSEPAMASEGEKTETAADEISEPASASHPIVNESAADGSAQESASSHRAAPVSPITEREQEVAALQNHDAPQNDDEQKRRRTHGGAIPR